MEASPKYNPVPRAVALVLAVFGITKGYQIYSAYLLQQQDSMSPAAYFQYHRAVYEHSFLFLFLYILVCLGFFLGVIDVLTFMINALLPKRRAD